MKYNYVIFGTEDPYYTYGYSELNERNDSEYLRSPEFEGKMANIQRFVRRMHMSNRIKKHIELPGKRIWNNKLFHHRFLNNNPICFVFFSGGPFADHIPYGFIEYLKETYKDSKYVVFYQDLVDSYERTVSIDTYKEKMDLLVSFDYADCERYNMLYHPLVYSDIASKVKPLNKKSDIYFCGAEKNRINEIIEAYEFFTKNGFDCDFNVITDKPELLNKKEKGIKYCRSFSYLENLSHIKACQSMLEIMQKGGTGYTIRALECIAFNRKLITNNSNISRADFYDDNNFMTFEKSIDSSVYKTFVSGNATTYNYINEILPHAFLEYIEKHL